MEKACGDWKLLLSSSLLLLLLSVWLFEEKEKYSDKPTAEHWIAKTLSFGVVLLNLLRLLCVDTFCD